MINFNLSRGAFSKLGQCLFFALAVSSCRPVVLFLDNDAEGFVDKQLNYTNYSHLGEEYALLSKVQLKIDEISFKEDIFQTQRSGDSLKWSVYSCQVKTRQIVKWGVAGISSASPKKINLKFDMWILSNSIPDTYKAALNDTVLEIPDYNIFFHDVIKSNDVLCPLSIHEKTSNKRNQIIDVYTPEIVVLFRNITSNKESQGANLLLNYIYHPPTRGILFECKGNVIGIGSESPPLGLTSPPNE